VRTLLADGTIIHCLQPFEPHVIDRDIPSYFSHGITLAAGDTVIDAGANIGLFALRALERCGGNLRLFCVEPVPQIHRVLAKNLGAAATVIPCALGEVSGRTELEYFPLMTANSGVCTVIPSDDRWAALVEDMARKDSMIGRVAQLVPRVAFALAARVSRARRQRVVCEVRTLSQLVDEYQIDRIALLKLDIEGCEAAALRGIAEAHWPRIEQVVAEIHDRQRDLAEIAARLEDHGFDVTIGERACVDDDCCNLYARRISDRIRRGAVHG
jgi:FkbM family methyltransferase